MLDALFQRYTSLWVGITVVAILLILAVAATGAFSVYTLFRKRDSHHNRLPSPQPLVPLVDENPALFRSFARNGESQHCLQAVDDHAPVDIGNDHDGVPGKADNRADDDADDAEHAPLAAMHKTFAAWTRTWLGARDAAGGGAARRRTRRGGNAARPTKKTTAGVAFGGGVHEPVPCRHVHSLRGCASKSSSRSMAR